MLLLLEEGDELPIRRGQMWDLGSYWQSNEEKVCISFPLTVANMLERGPDEGVMLI